MAAFLTLDAAISEPAAAAAVLEPVDLVQELRAALANANVTAGIDEALLEELAESAKEPTFQRVETLIAIGTPLVHGQAGYVELAFDEGLAPGRVTADGHMNFFDRGLLKSVRAGQLVATVHAPQAGQAGVTVDGQSRPASPGAVVKLKLGTGVTLDAGGAVRAERDGVVLHKSGELLAVVAEHVHQGAVDLHSGHLDMPGSLVVRGDVERLLQVRASGDVEVLGSVSGGSLRASGSIRVSGSVRGGDDAQVVAEHDVTIRSGEAAEVTAGAVLRVQEAVNSQLRARQVIVTGRLRGGAAVAESSLRVKEAGTPAGSSTLLQAGVPLDLPELADVQRAVVMQKLRRMAERGGVRDAFGTRGVGRAKGGKLGRADAAWSADELKERAEQSQRRAELERHAVVELGLAHAGVELRIGSARLNLQQTERGLRYALDSETGNLRAERIAG
jgi:uncharacterized protein (DUF342 family)